MISVDGQEEYNESMGRLVTDDLVYEGGLVVQDGRAIRDPAVETQGRSTQITVPQLAGETFSGDLERTGTTAIRVEDPTANVTLTVHSEYAPAWYEALERSGEARLVDGETVEVVFEGGNAPRPPTDSSAIAFGETGASRSARSTVCGSTATPPRRGRMVGTIAGPTRRFARRTNCTSRPAAAARSTSASSASSPVSRSPPAHGSQTTRSSSTPTTSPCRCLQATSSPRRSRPRGPDRSIGPDCSRSRRVLPHGRRPRGQQ
ncbi:hypothetical protein ACFQMM_09300 [Saliphagus sp. GCM10025308]